MIDPIFFSLGPISLRYYGLVYALGFLSLYFAYVKNQKRLGFYRDDCDLAVTFIILGMMIGARLFHFLFWKPSIFWVDPLELFKIWHGGMSFYGALIGSVVGLILFARSRPHVKVWAVLDVSVIVCSIALIFGRIANYINQELIGRVTDVVWCVHFVGVEGCRHPYPIYAAISHLVLAIVLLILYLKFDWREKLGTTFCAFLIGYGVLRFLTDFFRDDPLFFGFTSWQYVSLVVAVFGVWLLLRRLKIAKNK